jgi:competence protein ComEC
MMSIWCKQFLKHWHTGVLVVFIITNTFIWWQVSLASNARLLTVSFLDVGQGDAFLIEAPNGNQVLIDGGPGRAVVRALGEVMPWSDQTIDLIIATHPDADHIGGLPAVLERYQVLGVMDNGAPSETGYYEAWLSAKKTEERTGARVLLARRGQVINLGENLNLEIIYPASRPVSKETNDGSVVARLTYGEINFLLTGDAGFKVENALLAQGANLESEVLKVGHHGSKNSSSDSFIKEVSPKYAIISAGADNRYGHPSQTVLDKITRISESQILRTDDLGTIVCTSDSVNVTCQ